MISDNVRRVFDKITDTCRKIGRDPKEITLVGVTKFAPVEAINEAILAGISHVAENKVQEGESKYPQLTSAKPVTRHLIGHLQSNKAKDALQAFDLIQSVDSVKLVKEIEKQAVKLNRVADILVQINTAREEQKYGLAPEDVTAFFDQVVTLPHIRVLGVMAMAPFTDDKQVVAQCFKDLRKFKEQLASQYKGSSQIQMRTISMGMSQDLEIALQEGSNMVRIGSAIFKE